MKAPVFPLLCEVKKTASLAIVLSAPFATSNLVLFASGVSRLMGKRGKIDTMAASGNQGIFPCSLYYYYAVGRKGGPNVAMYE